MVKLGKLWGDAKFASLSPISKLLYCYLTTHPSISTLGVINVSLDRVELDLNSDELLAKYWIELEDKDYIITYPYEQTSKRIITVVVLDHFKSLPKSKSNLRKAIDEGTKANEELKEILRTIFTEKDAKDDSFKPPTPKEVAEYALNLGYLVNGKNFVEYYEDNDWYDKNDKKVRNWKSKLKKVWCRDTNKLETADGAPKGFEYFYVEIEEGHRIYPQSWNKGLPSHSNHIYAQYLIEEFNEQTNS